ncbi:MAG: hypothetical protein K5663_03085 [Clostridiales bacterium]|nr:hypothetical protein [Clostridiales bacterium]
MYLAVDGGGSKIAAVAYTDEMRPVCKARSGGVNITQNSPDDIVLHIKDCVGQLKPFLAEPVFVDEVFIGDRERFEQELRLAVKVESIRLIPEPVAGLYAGACRQNGILALSGTGSDVFIIKDGKVAGSVGGWGPVMGDQGSGVWIGLQAMRAVCRQSNGWGEKTMLMDLLSDYFGTSLAKYPPPYVVKAPAPYAIAAKLVPLAAKAAHEGDSVALDIFRRAGENMARQLEALLARFGPTNEREIVLCGGAWKAHPLMRESCEAYMRRIDSAFTLKPPCFEHVLAGPALRLMEKGMNEREVKLTLADRFPDMVIDSGGLFS